MDHPASYAHLTRSIGDLANAVGVAVMMGGRPAGVYGAEALEALAQFQATTA